MSLQPPSILLMGPSGSGKTHSLSTLIEAGLEVFVLSTEPRGIETFLDVLAAKKLPLTKAHWRYIPPARRGIDILIKQANMVSFLDQKGLADQKAGPRTDAQWIQFLEAIANFKCERDGKEYGPVDSWGPDRAFVIDSLTGISSMAMDITIGTKVTANPGEWGTAQNLIRQLLLLCQSSLNCFFILTAHTERENNEITGIQQIMASTVGAKLAPKLPQFFSEVVEAYTVSQGDTRIHLWSTNTPNYNVKNRALPISTKLEPTFAPVVAAHKARLAQIEPATKSA